jgi:hypothetical protein
MIDVEADLRVCPMKEVLNVGKETKEYILPLLQTRCRQRDEALSALWDTQPFYGRETVAYLDCLCDCDPLSA